MMRPVSLAYPPKAPSGLTMAKVGSGGPLTWTDNSLADTSFVVQRQIAGAAEWTDARHDPDVAQCHALPVTNPLNPRFTGVRTFNDTTYRRPAPTSTGSWPTTRWVTPGTTPTRT